MSDESEIESQKIRLKADGRLIQRVDGQENLIATFNRTTGVLEFETKEYSVKFYQQVTARLGSVKNGTEPSNLVIRSMRVKGDPIVKAGGKRPKMGPEGDATPALVDWYIKNALSEAITRYGIYTDANGKPIRKNVQRTITGIVDNRDGEEDPVPTPRKGQSHDGGPVKTSREFIKVKSAIIARRATRYEDNPDILDELGVDKLEALFTPQEVVGGFSPEEDFETAPVGAEPEVES